MKDKIRLYKRGRLGMKQMELNYFTKTETVRKTYPQMWHEYNLSQTTEKSLFISILRDLVQYVKFEDKKQVGRPKLNLHEMIYCMSILTYSCKSSRRSISELQMLKDLKLISFVPHFNSLLNYFNDKEATEQLKLLIQLSALPLKFVESDFAVDSTGFSTSLFETWNDYKWGQQEGKERIWRKAHVMSGVKTNIITSVEVTPKNVSDHAMFGDLVKLTSGNFKIKEVSADMAYLSRQNFDLVNNLGAVAYIPFKSNSNGKSRGSMIWHQMYEYFMQRRMEFMAHYHKRSNAESVFSMIKRKFGNHLRTKTDAGQTNEILCRLLCHNIIVLIHELFELGVSVDFEEIVRKTNFCANTNSAH